MPSQRRPALAVHADPEAPRTAVVVPLPGLRGLDDREVHAVALGRADAFRYGWDAAAAPAGLRRCLVAWLATLIGLRRVTPLADERLEALRLFACMMRRDDRGLDDHAARLLAAGFSRTALHQATNLALA